MTQMDDSLRMVGGKVPVYMLDVYIQRDGTLSQQFPELGDCLRSVEALCQGLPDDSDLEAAVGIVRQHGMQSVQDVVRYTASQISGACHLNVNELRALVAGLYIEWQKRRQRLVHTMSMPKSMSKAMRNIACRDCDSFGFLTVWFIDNVRMEEFLVRRLYGTDVMFDLASQDNVQVTRERCQACTLPAPTHRSK